MTQSEKVSFELKNFFARMGYSQRMIAEKIGVKQQVIGNLLNGRPFGRKTAERWREVFGFNPAWLITGYGEMFEQEGMVQPAIATTPPATNTPKQMSATDTSTDSIDVVKELTDSVAYQILKLVQDGTLYPKSVVEEKNELIREKDEEIQRLNREIGVLQTQLEQAGIEPSVKKDVV